MSLPFWLMVYLTAVLVGYSSICFVISLIMPNLLTASLFSHPWLPILIISHNLLWWVVSKFMHYPLFISFQLVKRIFRCSTCTIDYGIRLPSHSTLELYAFSDVDRGGCPLTHSSIVLVFSPF